MQRIKHIFTAMMVAAAMLVFSVSYADTANTAKTVILAKTQQFFHNPNTPTQNDKGKITVVEFFDYQCPFCHMLAGVIEKAAANNSNLRLVYKDLPIRGPVSVYAARGSFATYQQSPKLYLAYRDALFGANIPEGQLTIAEVDAIAKKVGVNMQKFHQLTDKKYSNTPAYKAVSKELQNSINLAQSLQLMGTPALIVAPTDATANTPAAKIAFTNGYVPEATLQQYIQQVQ